MSKRSIRIVSLAAVLLFAGSAHGQGRAARKSAKEAAEYLAPKLGLTAAKEGTEALALRIERYAATHGDDFIQAVRQVGPRAFSLVDEAAEHGAKATRVLARYGEKGAVHVVSRPQSLSLFIEHGDDCARVLCEHPGIAEPLITKAGAPAVKAFGAVGPQNGRRLAMLAENGALAKAGREVELLEVVGKYGDRAADFIWRHKGALAIGATLTAFLANPEPFLDGTQVLAGTIAENVVRPIAEAPGKVATEVAKGTNWTVVFVAVLIVVTSLFVGWYWLRHQSRRPTPVSTAASTTPKAKPKTTRVPNYSRDAIRRMIERN